MSYSVNLWGSHPDEGNDDCWAGTDFDSLEQAMVVYKDPSETFRYETNWNFIVLDGPGIHMTRKNPKYKPRGNEYNPERSEFAVQNGMAFGCDGYNDAMGY